MDEAANSDWTPPTDPDPSAVFDQARKNVQAGRFADALAQLVWFHNNALTYEPALAGVRLSYALSEWTELGERYPPALDALRQIASATAERLRGNVPRSHDLHDFASINSYLREDAATADLFAWLDEHRPEFAAEAYDIAQPALIRARRFELCTKHVDPEEALPHLVGFLT
jgi:hypothetical protein